MTPDSNGGGKTSSLYLFIYDWCEEMFLTEEHLAGTAHGSLQYKHRQAGIGIALENSFRPSF